MIPEKELKNYQSIPFWSWNDKLEPEELRRQIRNMKKAGIGGFFHAMPGAAAYRIHGRGLDESGGNLHRRGRKAGHERLVLR